MVLDACEDRLVRPPVVVLRAAVMGLLLASPGAAQAPPPGDATDGAPVAGKPVVDSESPRVSVAAYIDLCRAGRFAEAARYLSLSETDAGAGAELARHLKAVTVPGADGRPEAVRMVRVEDGDGARWTFSPR